MKGRQILIEPRADGGAAAALLVNGQLEDLLIDPTDAAPRPEAIHRAVVGRPMKGLGGVIVELGGGATGFLRGPKPPAPGSRLLVQVSNWAEPGKAAPVSQRITLKGRFAVLTPGAPGLNLSRAITEEPLREALSDLAHEAMAGESGDLGLILRSLTAEADGAEIIAEIAALRADWARLSAQAGSGPAGVLRPAPGARTIARREWPLHAGEPVEEHPQALARAGVWETAADLLRPRVTLASGFMTIEPTRALVAVDVNTGGELSPGAALQTNIAAARELPRQLRLRGLGGQVVVDFAPLAKTERARIESTLKAQLRRDDIETTIAGWTPLGHLEIQRRRARRPLQELPVARD